MAKSDLKILIYSQDGFGLGHLRRNLNIAIRLIQQRPSLSILIIADSPVAPFFELPPECDFVKIPTIVKVDSGVWRTDRLPEQYEHILSIRSEIIKDVALSFRPDVFLVDHMPGGAMGELVQPLEVLKRALPETQIVLGLRDILGAPQTIFDQWSREGAYAAAEQFYDSILVYGCSDLFNVASQYRFPAALLSRTSHCGYICQTPPTPCDFDKNILLKLFARPKGPFVLVTGGGSFDAYSFMRTFLEAVPYVQAKTQFHAMVATGPFMNQKHFVKLTDKARGLPVIVTPTGPEAINLLRRADLVISMGGYNTVSEILFLRKNAIVIPRKGPSAEQTMRCRLMSERNLFATIEHGKLTPKRLARTILAKLNATAGMPEPMIPELTGAHTVSSHIISKTSIGQPAPPLRLTKQIVA